MAYDKAYKIQRRNDRNSKNAQRKVFSVAAVTNRDEDETENRRRYY